MGRRSGTVLATAAVAAAVVLVMWAAVAGPGQVLSGEGLDRVPLAEPTPSESEVAAEGGDGSDREREQPEPVPAWLRTVVRGLVLVLELAVVAATGWLLWRGTRRAVQAWDARRRRDDHAQDLSGAEVVLEEESGARSLLRDAGGRRARLVAEGEPRNAVVACWLELEGLAAAHGVRRHEAETSTELAQRWLARTGADPEAVRVLAAAYHRARYAETPVSDVDRSRALQALDRLHASAATPRPGAGVGR